MVQYRYNNWFILFCFFLSAWHCIGTCFIFILVYPLSWDDILVGSPIYSEPSRREVGRVTAYVNNQVIPINDLI